ncbi:MAG: hypothetical protein GYA50_09950 [Eubacteriaceae bacterium]|nr:hypothetical protein [Eubacteriaceae bacterium]
MLNAQIVLLLLGLYYINNNSSHDYIKFSDDVAERLGYMDADTPHKLLQPVYNNITVDNARQILTQSYKIKHAVGSIKNIKLCEGINNLDTNSFVSLLYDLEPYMDDNERNRYTKVNSVISGVGRATKGISRINNISGEFSSAQNLKEKAGMLFELLSPLIGSDQLSQAKNIADLISAMNFASSAKAAPQSEADVDDDYQKNKILDIIESIEAKKS